MLPHGSAYRPAVSGLRGMVTSAHPLASMAGVEMLLDGGNAMDAAIATAAALNVVEYYRSGLGGVGVMVVSSAKRRERLALDFTGFAPQDSDASDATTEDLQIGPKAMVTPGALGGWLAALERFGTMPRSKIFAPAIRLAEQGFPLTLRTCEFLRLALPRLATSETGRRIVLGEGAPRPGAIFVQADMARTLREIVEGGVAAFYDGPLGRVISNGVEQSGGWLRESDLAACRPTWQTPLRGSFGGADLIVPPPPCSGWQVLETLNILEGFELQPLGHNSADYLHLFIEAAKLAAADRVAYAHAEHLPRAEFGGKTLRRPATVPVGSTARKCQRRGTVQPSRSTRTGATGAPRSCCRGDDALCRGRLRNGGQHDAQSGEHVWLGVYGPWHGRIPEQFSRVDGSRCRQPKLSSGRTAD